MRTMMRVTIPVDAGNAAIKAGRMTQIVTEAMGRMKPEAAYFTADQHIRGQGEVMPVSLDTGQGEKADAFRFLNSLREEVTS